MGGLIAACATGAGGRRGGGDGDRPSGPGTSGGGRTSASAGAARIPASGPRGQTRQGRESDAHLFPVRHPVRGRRRGFGPYRGRQAGGGRWRETHRQRDPSGGARRERAQGRGAGRAGDENLADAGRAAESGGGQAARCAPDVPLGIEAGQAAVPFHAAGREGRASG